jgi:hypothetical protein
MDAGIAEQVAHDLSQPVRGTRVLDHLQFVRAFGLRQGVRSTGWPAVDVASCLAAQIGATAARFVTGFGALCRPPDITRWAQTVAALLAPGGFLYLAEYHPFADALAEELPGRRRHRLPEEACAVTAAEWCGIKSKLRRPSSGIVASPISSCADVTDGKGWR